MRNAWALLDLEPGSDRAAIRRAYAKKLKVTNPEDDPKGFMALREAYEWLLGHVEYAAHDLDEFRGGEASEHRFDPGLLDAVVAEPAKPAAAPERDPELDRLDALLTRLAANLAQGGTDGRLLSRELLADILASPAMLSLAVAARVEQALATMIAQNVPSSDAIILPALDAFDWTDQRRAHQYPYAEIIARLDEWRIIQALDHPSDPSHKAWQALIRLAPAPLRWFQARTRRRHDIADLLDFIDYQCPGVAFSASAAAIDWWRQELTVERETIEPWLTRFAAAGGVLLLLLGVKIEPMRAVISSILFLALLIVDRLATQRLLKPRFEVPSRRHDALLFAGMFALPIGAAFLPIGWPLTAAVVLAAIALTWRLRWVTGPQRSEPLMAAVAPGIALGVSSLVLLTTDTPLPLSGMIMLVSIGWMLFGQGLQLRLRMASLLDSVDGAAPWPLTCVVAGAMLFAGFSRQGDPVSMAMHMLSVVLAVYAVNGVAAMLQRPPPSFILGCMIIAAALLMIGAMSGVTDDPTPNDATAGEAIVAVGHASAGSTIELPERQAQEALNLMAGNNPELLAQINRILIANYGVFDREKAAIEIDKLLDDAVRERLLRSSDGLIAAEQKVRERLLAYWRGHDIAVCATQLRADQNVPPDVLAELRRVRLGIAAGPLVDRPFNPLLLKDLYVELPKQRKVALDYAESLAVPTGAKPQALAQCNQRFAAARALASFPDEVIAEARRTAQRGSR